MSQETKLSVVITGSHGVGKTTLAESLIAKYSKVMDVSLTPETARIIASLGYEVNDNITLEGVKTYLQTYEQNFMNTDSNLSISDRCILDLYAYTKHLYMDGERLGSTLGKLVKSKMEEDIKRHDLFIFVPIEFEMKEDGIRPAETSFQFEIEKRIRQILIHENVDFITVSGALQNRISIVAKELKERFGINANVSQIS